MPQRLRSMSRPHGIFHQHDRLGSSLVCPLSIYKPLPWHNDLAAEHSYIRIMIVLDEEIIAVEKHPNRVADNNKSLRKFEKGQTCYKCM